MTGPGGAGKTSLAIEAAATDRRDVRLVRLADGIVADLAGLRAAVWVVAALAWARMYETHRRAS